jgi:hypothetical protein
VEATERHEAGAEPDAVVSEKDPSESPCNVKAAVFEASTTRPADICVDAPSTQTSTISPSSVNEAAGFEANLRNVLKAKGIEKPISVVSPSSAPPIPI